MTVTVAKADVGGWAGDASTHPDLLEAIVPSLDTRTESGGLLLDFVVTHVGDDVAVLMTHERGARSAEVRGAAAEAFRAAGARAVELKLHAATTSPHISYADMEFVERPSEPLVVIMTDKAGPGAFNLPLYRSFGDPFTTWGLVEDPSIVGGFEFEVTDLLVGKRAAFRCPEESHGLLGVLGRSDGYALTEIRSRAQPAEPAAVTSVGAHADVDPTAIVRAGPGFPSVGEVLEPWARPLLVPGPGPARPPGPILPVGLDDTVATRADGPPRAIALGFTLADGELVGPLDLFADAAFDRARADALLMADFLRRQGPFALRSTTERGPLMDAARWR